MQPQTLPAGPIAIIQRHLMLPNSVHGRQSWYQRHRHRPDVWKLQKEEPPALAATLGGKL